MCVWGGGGGGGLGTGDEELHVVHDVGREQEGAQQRIHRLRNGACAAPAMHLLMQISDCFSVVCSPPPRQPAVHMVPGRRLCKPPDGRSRRSYTKGMRCIGINVALPDKVFSEVWGGGGGGGRPGWKNNWMTPKTIMAHRQENSMGPMNEKSTPFLDAWKLQRSTQAPHQPLW